MTLKSPARKPAPGADVSSSVDINNLTHRDEQLPLNGIGLVDMTSMPSAGAGSVSAESGDGGLIHTTTNVTVCVYGLASSRAMASVTSEFSAFELELNALVRVALPALGNADSSWEASDGRP